jgi:hypothetical protein
MIRAIEPRWLRRLALLAIFVPALLFGLMVGVAAGVATACYGAYGLVQHFAGLWASAWAL